MATATITAGNQYTAFVDSPVTAGTTLFTIIAKQGVWSGDVIVQAKVTGDADALAVDVGASLEHPTLVNLVLPNGFSVRAGVKGGYVNGSIPVEVLSSTS